MTYTPHVWSRHDKLDSLALNSLEQAVGAFSGTADEATAAAATANTAAANAASSAQAAAASAALVGAPAGSAIDAHLGGDSTTVVPNVTSLIGKSQDIRIIAPAVDLTGATTGSSAFNAMLTALPSGASVFIPSGSTIDLTAATVNVTKPVHIIAAGATFVCNGTSAAFTLTSGANGSTFYGLTITGNKPTAYAAANRAFYLNGTPASWVDNIKFDSCMVTGMGFGGWYGTNVSNISCTNCTVKTCVYAGFLFLSGKNIILINPTIDTLQGISANSFMESYPVAFTRDKTQASITDYPNSQTCTVWGGLIQNAPWEGIDTHGGIDVKVFGVTILGCKYPISFVPCPNTSGTDTWAPTDCVIAFNNIDSLDSAGNVGAVGIRLVGAGGAGSRVMAASGVIIGNTVRRYGAGTTATGGTADPTTFNGAIQIYQTDGVKIDDNRLIEPSPFGISIHYDNTACQIGMNTVTDCWSNTFIRPSAVYVNSSGNEVQLGAVKHKAGTKSATYLNVAGLYISDNSNTITFTGGHDFGAAATAFVGGSTTFKQAFMGKQPITKPAAIASPTSDTVGTKAAIDSIRAALTNLGLTS